MCSEEFQCEVRVPLPSAGTYFPSNSFKASTPMQFSQHLHENASYIRPLEEGMLHLFESITEDTVTVLVIFLLMVFLLPFFKTTGKRGLSLSGSVFNCGMIFIQETTVKLKPFSDHLASYIRFLRKILPYQLKRYLFPAGQGSWGVGVGSDLFWS